MLAIISALSPELLSPPTNALRVVTEDAEAKSELVVVVKTSLAKASLTLTAVKVPSVLSYPVKKFDAKLSILVALADSASDCAVFITVFKVSATPVIWLLELNVNCVFNSVTSDAEARLAFVIASPAWVVTAVDKAPVISLTSLLESKLNTGGNVSDFDEFFDSQKERLSKKTVILH